MDEYLPPASLVRKAQGAALTSFKLDAHRILWRVGQDEWYLQTFKQVPVWHDAAGQFRTKVVTAEFAARELSKTDEGTQR